MSGIGKLITLKNWMETQLDKITQLEQQIATREELTMQLIRSILKNAFEGNK